MIYRTNSSRAISEAFYAVNNDAINEFYNIDTKPYNVYTEENVFKVIWGGIKAFFRMLRDLFMRFINWIKSLFSKHKATAAADDAKAKEVVKAVAALPAGNSIAVAALPAASLPARPAPSDDFGNIKAKLREIEDLYDHKLVIEDNEDGRLVAEKLSELPNAFNVMLVPYRPTAEEMSRDIFYKLKSMGLNVSEVELFETPTNSCTYSED